MLQVAAWRGNSEQSVSFLPEVPGGPGTLRTGCERPHEEDHHNDDDDDEDADPIARGHPVNPGLESVTFSSR